MRKKLIVSGCSFTDKDFTSLSAPDYDCSFPKWPELLAEKLDMDCINLGANGSGNTYIYSTLLEQITRTPKDEIGLVLAAWSQVNRQDYQVYTFKKPNFSHQDMFHNNMVWKNKRIGREGDIFFWLKETLRNYISFQNLCKYYNLPYKQFQMIHPFGGYVNGLRKTDFEIVQNLDNPNFVKKYKYNKTTDNDIAIIFNLLIEYEKFIDEKNFIGWPPTNSLGGHTIEAKTLFDEKGENLKDLIISEYDFHPNEKGHKKIAEFIYDRLG
tara:strand:- start:776 stop:1579 length:804 start_codon:yes stop_codon:yes gene_type:complete